MIALTDDQLKLLMAVAEGIALSNRDQFLWRFAERINHGEQQCASTTTTHQIPTTEMAS
jgi:hypothetical protein